MTLENLMECVGCKNIVIKTDAGTIFNGRTEFVLDNEVYFENCLSFKVRSVDPAFDKVRKESYLIITIC